MWEKLNKIRAAVILAVGGTVLVTIFIMALVIVAAIKENWEFVDKWITMLFTSLVSNAFLGFLYVKSKQPE